MEDPKGRCNYCNVYAGRDKLKTCGRCRLVRYCSKTCQVAAWRTHKQRCTPSLRKSLAKDPVAYALNAAMSKWINNWRYKLYDCVLSAMDLANHPEDRLATHSLVIELECCRNSSNQSFHLKMHSGDVMTRENILTRFRAINDLSDDMVAHVNERRDNITAQIIVICEDLARILWFSLRDGGASLRQRDPALSRALAQLWKHHLTDTTDDIGQPISEPSSIHDLKESSEFHIDPSFISIPS